MGKKKKTSPSKKTIIVIALAILAPGGVIVAFVNGWFGSGSETENDNSTEVTNNSGTAIVAERSTVIFNSPNSNPPTAEAEKPIVLIIDSESREEEIEFLAGIIRPLESLSVDEEPVHGDFFAQCTALSGKKPAVVVAHWHTLRGIEESDVKAQEKLLEGLLQIYGESKSTQYVLYSRAFGKQSADDSWKVIQRAVDRLAHAGQPQREHYENLLEQMKIIAWPENDEKDKGNFTQAIRDSIGLHRQHRGEQGVAGDGVDIDD